MSGMIETSCRVVDSPAREPDKRSARLELAKFDSFEAAGAIREEWDQLAERLEGDIFGTFEWCAAWWRHFSLGRSLVIYAARRNGELAAVIPLFRETLRWGAVKVRVVRVLGTDHAGTRCYPLFDPEVIDDLAVDLLRALDNAGEWDVFHIGDLPGYYPHARRLAAALQRESHRPRIFLHEGYYPHAVFDVPGDFETYLSRLSGNERNNIRKADRRIAASATLRADAVPRDELSAAFAELCRWHGEHWLARGEIGFFDKWPGASAFHEDVAAAQAEAGRLVLFRLRADEDLIGYVYAQQFGRRLHFFQSVRAPQSNWESCSPGRLLHCAAIRAAIDEHLTLVDSMSGFYEYKRRLGAQFLGLKCIAAVRRRWPSRIRVAVFRAITGLIHLVYFRVWYSKLAPFLRRRLGRSGPRFLGAPMSRTYIRSRFVLDALSGRPSNIQGAESADE